MLPQKGPRAKMLTWDQKSNPGLKKPSPGLKQQKMRAEKPCRTQASEFQTEPYSTSYGQKLFWRVPAKILNYLGANPVLKKGNPVFKKGNPVFKKGNPAFKKGNPAFKKGNPEERKSCIQERESQWDQWDQGPWDQGAMGTGTMGPGTGTRDRGQ